MFSSGPVRSLAIIGGGVAGLAAAEHAALSGWAVSLFEWKSVLGGRAASLYDTTSSQWIDNGQHLVMGCCSHFLQMAQRTGWIHDFRKVDTIPFLDVNGHYWCLKPAAWLPKNLQLLPSFLKSPYFSWYEKLELCRQLWQLASEYRRMANFCLVDGFTKMTHWEKTNDASFAKWMSQQGVTSRVRRFFWDPLCFSALCETAENVSTLAVAKVVHDGFMSGSENMAMYIPTKPLRDIFHHRTLPYLKKLGVAVELGQKIVALHGENPISLTFQSGVRRNFDAVVLAVPPRALSSLLRESNLSDMANTLRLDENHPCAITSVHLWLSGRLLPHDKEVDEVAFVDGPAQWLFWRKTVAGGEYHLALVSAAHRLLSSEHRTIIGAASLVADVMKQLERHFPEKFAPSQSVSHVSGNEPIRLLHSRVTTVPDSVYSPSPEWYSARPYSQIFGHRPIFLAGDWTQTGWPCTLEGAVRSGQTAVVEKNSLLHKLSHRTESLIPFFQ